MRTKLKKTYIRYSAGFSLVELSIVLVILGLLVGGIMTGQNLIRAAELRSITTEANQYATAINTFQDRYLKLPGDLSNATSFWPPMATCPPPDSDPLPPPVREACNGDGNGKIGDKGGGYTSSSRHEWLYAWQHLSNAGMVSGQYGGISRISGSSNHEPGVNCPRTKADSQACWGIMYIPPDGWHATTGSGSNWMHTNFLKQNGGYFPMQYGNTLILGRPDFAAPVFPIMSSEEMWNLDRKMDDGKPDTGFLLSQRYNLWVSNTFIPSPCYSDPGDGVWAYDFSVKEQECAPIFRFEL